MNTSFPETWQMVKLGVCLRRRKDTVMPSTLDDGIVGLVGLEDIQDGGRGGIAVRPTNPSDIDSLKTRFQVGDILYGKLRPYLNKVGIAQSDGLCSTEIWAFTTESFLEARFASYYLASSFFVDRVESLTKGANLPRLDSESFDSISIPLPTLSEQQRIVDILQEAEEIRRLRAQAEAKTAELIPELFHDMFGDPVSNTKQWRKAPLGQLINGTPKNGLYKPADLYGEGTPIIRIGDFTGGILRDAKGLQRVRISDEEASQFGVANGQIVLNRVNSIEHLGKSLLLAGLNEPTVYESNMMRLDPKLDQVLPDYLIACLHHGAILSKLRAKAKKAINQASINQTDVVTLEIPVPPLEAQHKFTAQVRAIDEILSDEGQTLRKGQVLEKALTAHAFTGQLTEEWREKHQKALAAESRGRDAALQKAGAPRLLSRRATIQEMDRIWEDNSDGRYADMSREQRALWREIERMVGGVDYGRYFTAEQLAADSPGPLHRHPQAIESHLSVFAVRGLIIPVSRPRNDSAGSRFAACYRLPLKEDDVRPERLEHQRKLAVGDI